MAHLTRACSINVPPFDGMPKQAAEVWRLQKGNRHAICTLWTHPIGCEARVLVDGELHRSEAGRIGLLIVELALDWRERFREKGWCA
jgi:hypothetical protein